MHLGHVAYPPLWCWVRQLRNRRGLDRLDLALMTRRTRGRQVDTSTNFFLETYHRAGRPPLLYAGLDNADREEGAPVSGLSVPEQPIQGNQADHTGKIDLVLQGGGVKGIGLVGAVNMLRDASYPHVQRVAGTSAGAIVASLIAAGMPSAQMEEVMCSLNYAQFQDASLLARLGTPGKGLALLLRGGCYKTDFMHGWIASQLEACGVRTWRDLKYTDDGADTHLAPEQRYKLVVIVSDISRGRMLRLPWDYHTLCDLNPDDLPVADAVIASAAIPFFFQAQHLTCGPAQNKQKLTLTDGGSLSNYPIGIFDRTDSAPSRWPTLGIKLSARLTPAAGWHAINNPITMFLRLFSTMSSAHDNVYVDQESVQARTVFVDTTGTSATDFTLDDQKRDLLFNNGRDAAEAFLKEWNWEQWQNKYANSPVLELDSSAVRGQPGRSVVEFGKLRAPKILSPESAQ
jgi:NTE family protein